MEKKVVPLVIYQGSERIVVGTANVSTKPGTNGLEFSINKVNFASPELAKVYECAIDFAVSIDNQLSAMTLPNVTANQVREQASLYGKEMHDLADREMLDDMLRVRQAWKEYQKQFENSPELMTAARESYLSAYGATFAMVIPRQEQGKIGEIKHD